MQKIMFSQGKISPENGIKAAEDGFFGRLKV
jgi:hypothetical protein